MPLFQTIGQTLGLIPATPTIKKTSSIPTQGRPNLSLATRLEAQRMSPSSRTQDWLANNSPEKKIKIFKDSHTPSVLGVKNGGITKHAHTPKHGNKSRNKYLAVKFDHTSSSPSATKPEVKRKSGLWSLLTGFCSKDDGKAVVKSEVTAFKSDNESVMEGSTLIEEVIDTIETDEYLDGPSNIEGPTLLAQTKGGDLKIQDENGNIKAHEEADFDDFTDEEYFLFHKLNARGMEPLIPLSWSKDFMTLDWDMFSNNPRKTYIKPTKTPDYHGKSFSLPPLSILH